MADTVKDRDGNTWQPFVNQFPQRQLRCVAGPRLGDVAHDPRLHEYAGRSISSRDPAQPASDPWLERLFRSEYRGVSDD
jgi:hypothetical protein